MNMIKLFCVAGVFFALILSVAGAENLLAAPGASYTVFPGDWNKKLINDKNLGKYIDPDYDRATEKRRGLLTDGKTEQRAVCYNYHWTLKDQRFITIVADLGKESTIDNVQIVAFRNNDAYQPGKFEIAISNNNVEYTDLAKGDSWVVKKHYQCFADIPANGAKCRYIRIKVWTLGAWINISEIGVSGK